MGEVGIHLFVAAEDGGLADRDREPERRRRVGMLAFCGEGSFDDLQLRGSRMGRVGMTLVVAT